MSEELHVYRNIIETDEWIRQLHFYASMGALGKVFKQITSERRREIGSTKGMLSNAITAQLKGLRVEDVGRAGAEQLIRENAREYVRPSNKVVKADYAASMFAIVLRELSRTGRVSYASFSPSATQPNEAIRNLETTWTFNETPQNIIAQIERLYRQMSLLTNNTGIVAARPEQTIRIAHFMSAAADMMGRR